MQIKAALLAIAVGNAKASIAPVESYRSLVTVQNAGLGNGSTLTVERLPGGIAKVTLEETSLGKFYLGVCIGSCSGMTNCHCVIGNWDGTNEVNEYSLTGQSKAGVVKFGSKTITSASFVKNGQKGTLTFTMPAGIAGETLDMNKPNSLRTVAGSAQTAKHDAKGIVQIAAVPAPTSVKNTFGGVDVTLTPLADGNFFVEANALSTNSGEWVGVGIAGQDGGMPGASVVICNKEALTGTLAEPAEVTLPGRTSTTTAFTGASTVTSKVCKVNRGRISLSFIAKSIAGRTIDAAKPKLIAATGGKTYRQHDTKGTLELNLAAAPLPPAARVGQKQVLGGKGLLAWAFPSSDSIEITLEYKTGQTFAANSQSWLAVGLGQQMINSEVVYGDAVDGVQQRTLKTKVAATAYEINGFNGVTQSSFESSADGVLTLKFTASDLNTKSFNLQGTDSLVLAYGNILGGKHVAFDKQSITWKSDESTPPPSAPSAAPPTVPPTPAGPATVDTLAGGKMEYVVKDGVADVTLSFKTSGWVAVGLGGGSGGSAMVGSKVLIFDDRGFKEYIITAKAPIGSGSEAPVQSITGATVTKDNGVTTIKFKASAIAGTALKLDGEDALVFAQADDIKSSNKHSTYTSVKINWPSGGVAGNDRATIVLAHGAIMVACMLFLMPLAIIPSVFREKLGLLEGTPAVWFVIHRSLQMFNCFMVICSFFLIVANAQSHFDSLHKIFGLVIILLCFAQPILAIFFRKGDKISRSTWFNSHLLFGAIITLGSVATCLMGVTLAQPVLGEDGVKGLKGASTAGGVFVILVAGAVTLNRVVWLPAKKSYENDLPLSKSRGQVIRFEESKITKADKKGSFTIPRVAGDSVSERKVDYKPSESSRIQDANIEDRI